MITKLIQKFKSGSEAANTFANNPDSPCLISFPRTGSHWLRMLLEKYTNLPMLPRSFYNHDNNQYLLNHTHDYEFAKQPNTLLYLYRDPVPTIYSQIRFHNQDPYDTWQVELWSTMYRLHLQHWLLRDHPDRTIITYESMKENLPLALTPILQRLNQPVDSNRIQQIAADIDHAHVASKTQHDKRVMNTESNYQDQRVTFAQSFGNYIRRKVIIEGNLERYFTHILDDNKGCAA